MRPSTSLRLPAGCTASGLFGVVLEQAVFVARQAEEVVLLHHVLDRRAVDGAVGAAVELVFLVVELAADAVETLVAVELDVAGVVDPLEHLLHRGAVAGLGGADVVVVGDVELVPRLAEQRAVGVGPLRRGDAPRLGGTLHLEAVLVGAGEEDHVVAPEPAPAGQHVGRDRGVRVPDVGRVVHVVDGRGDVEGLGHRRHPIALPSASLPFSPPFLALTRGPLCRARRSAGTDRVRVSGQRRRRRVATS